MIYTQFGARRDAMRCRRPRQYYETEEEAKQEVDVKPGLAQGSSRFSFSPSASEATYQSAHVIGG
jgi:hypothetical protein